MILSGADENQAIREISRLVSDLTRAKVAGVVTRSGSDKPEQTVRGFTRDGVQSRFVERTGLPYGEGVSGWALIHGRTATSRNVFADGRYDVMTEVAKSVGQRSAVAAPIVLDGEILGALMLGYEEERDFDPSELSTLERLADQAAIAISNARQRQALRDIALGTAVALADVIESRDPYTGDHSSRLVLYSSLIAEELGMRAKELEIIRLGAALHDVGKIVVPDEVLKKPDKLTPDEFAIIRQHSYVGGQICKKIPFLAEVYPIVYHHHESFDGTGYPDGLRGEGIPLGAGSWQWPTHTTL
jgi:putative nucleotidyltransferase with HDIG domain